MAQQTPLYELTRFAAHRMDFHGWMMPHYGSQIDEYRVRTDAGMFYALMTIVDLRSRT